MQPQSFEPKAAIASLVPLQYRNIDYSPLTNLGCQFGVLHLRRIAELGVVTCAALQYSIYALAHAIENKWTPPGLPKRTYLEAFMDAIYTFGVFETPEYLDHIKNAQEKNKEFAKSADENQRLVERIDFNNDDLKDSHKYLRGSGEYKNILSRNEFHDFSEMQKVVLKFMFNNVDHFSLMTGRLWSGDIAKALNRTQASIKSALKRLEKMGAVERAQWKNGVQGWTRYRLPESTVKLLRNSERRMI